MKIPQCIHTETYLHRSTFITLCTNYFGILRTVACIHVHTHTYVDVCSHTFGIFVSQSWDILWSTSLWFHGQVGLARASHHLQLRSKLARSQVAWRWGVCTASWRRATRFSVRSPAGGGACAGAGWLAKWRPPTLQVNHHKPSIFLHHPDLILLWTYDLLHFRHFRNCSTALPGYQLVMLLGRADWSPPTCIKPHG